jgi:hypothetical protein
MPKVQLRTLLLMGVVGSSAGVSGLARADFVTFQSGYGTQAFLKGSISSSFGGGSSVFSTPIPAIQTFDPLGSQPTATLSKIGTVQDRNGSISTGGAAFSWAFSATSDAISIYGTNSSSCSGGYLNCFASSYFTTYFTALVPLKYSFEASYNYVTPVSSGSSEYTRAMLFQRIPNSSQVTTIAAFGASVISSRVTITNPNDAVSGTLNPGTYGFQTDTSLMGNILGANGEMLSTMNGSLVLSPVASIPEPESYELMLCGIGLLGFAMRRRSGAIAVG